MGGQRRPHIQTGSGRTSHTAHLTGKSFQAVFRAFRLSVQGRAFEEGPPAGGVFVSAVIQLSESTEFGGLHKDKMVAQCPYMLKKGCASGVKRAAEVVGVNRGGRSFEYPITHDFVALPLPVGNSAFTTAPSV